jgi:plastocyanin
MQKTNVFLFLVVVILAVSNIYLWTTKNTSQKIVETKGQVEKPNPMMAQIPVDLTNEQKTELKTGSDNHSPATLTFHVTGGSFYFTPNEISVKQGDKVKIIFTNVLGTHNLIFDDLGISTKIIKEGESDTIEFTAEKKGTYEFYCGVGNGYHRMKGQIGVLLVK